MEALKDAAYYVYDTVKGIANALTWDQSKVQDLTGWHILVVGASDGVGYEAAKAFAQHGAHVTVHGRNEEKTNKAAQQLREAAGGKGKVDVVLADLTSFKSIKAMADEIKARKQPLHVLLNNAAIQSPKGQRGALTEDGFEITMQTNHFGLLYLTLLLLDLVRESARSGPTGRIVFVSSMGHQLVNSPVIGASDKDSWGVDAVNWDDLRGVTKKDSDWWAYAQTKLFNLMAAEELAARLQGTGVKVFCCHPGMSVTDHFGKSDSEHKVSSRIAEASANSPWGQSAARGAIPLVYACTAPELEDRSGAYVGAPESFPVGNVLQARVKSPNAPMARNPAATKRLLDESLKILGETTREDWGAKLAAVAASA